MFSHNLIIASSSINVSYSQQSSVVWLGFYSLPQAQLEARVQIAPGLFVDFHSPSFCGELILFSDWFSPYYHECDHWEGAAFFSFKCVRKAWNNPSCLDLCLDLSTLGLDSNSHQNHMELLEKKEFLKGRRGLGRQIIDLQSSLIRKYAHVIQIFRYF